MRVCVCAAVCPEIQDELLRQRIANTTPENREIYYENERRKKAIEDMAARYVCLSVVL
jgi:hypothetical protein